MMPQYNDTLFRASNAMMLLIYETHSERGICSAGLQGLPRNSSGAVPSPLHPKTRNPGALWGPRARLTKARHWDSGWQVEKDEAPLHGWTLSILWQRCRVQLSLQPFPHQQPINRIQIITRQDFQHGVAVLLVEPERRIVIDSDFKRYVIATSLLQLTLNARDQ